MSAPDRKKKHARHSPHVSEIISKAGDLKRRNGELSAEIETQSPGLLESDRFQISMLTLRVEALISLLAEKGTINRSKFNIEYYSRVNKYFEGLLEKDKETT